MVVAGRKVRRYPLPEANSSAEEENQDANNQSQLNPEASSSAQEHQESDSPSLQHPEASSPALEQHHNAARPSPSIRRITSTIVQE